MSVIISFVIFVVALGIFLYWQHCYFAPRSFDELDAERREIENAAKRAIHEFQNKNEQHYHIFILFCNELLGGDLCAVSCGASMSIKRASAAQ